MNFLENIFHRLDQRSERPVLQETREGRIDSTSGGELLALIQAARGFLRAVGLKKGDRCALLAPNSIRWAALDLAIMAEGIIAVPLYTRQAPEELISMMKDCTPSFLCCGDETLRQGILQNWPEAPRARLLDEVFSAGPPTSSSRHLPVGVGDADPLTIIYTSGTSGEPKGVVLNTGNVGFMLACTNARLDTLMGAKEKPDRVFHYLPTCFAGSWILLLTCLTRNSVLTLCTDLSKLTDEIRLATPDYMLNVPAVLERICAGVEEQVNRQGGLVRAFYRLGKRAWFRRQSGDSSPLDDVVFALAQVFLFSAVRKRMGSSLKALICGSAPLAEETQLFFMMLGLPVLQVYGLTETTAICTMDDPHHVVPGRVGPAISGVEMKLGEAREILVRGPNIFPGYWDRPEETAKVFLDGWFRTGDQGDVDADANWKVIGRLKNLIISASGHNIAPEPIEEMLLRTLPGAQEVVVVGNGRSFLAALVTGKVAREQVEVALEKANAELAHYKRIRAFHILEEPFTIENGLLTANGKLRRDAIAARFHMQIEELYRKTP